MGRCRSRPGRFTGLSSRRRSCDLGFYNLFVRGPICIEVSNIDFGGHEEWQHTSIANLRFL